MMIPQRFNDVPPPLDHETRPQDDPFAPGTQILGKYTIVRTLGRGGMGVVVAARHNRLEEIHAIKFLLPGAVADRQTLGRFEREARAAARLRGEHAVRVHDVGYMETDQPYMVMDYVEGQNLKTVLRRGPLPIDEAAEYLLQICDALTEVHTAGIVHRDLKPANLLLTMRPTGTLCIKLLDFGIAKFMGADSPSDVEEVDLTCDAMIGSLRYMSPEHIASTRSVDWRTDLWALGVTAYELLTARTPFAGHTRMDMMSSILDKHKKPEALRALRPEVSPAIEGVILRCLEKDRNDRFQSAAEVARALRDAMGLPGPVLPSNRTEMPSITAATALSVTDEPERQQESRMTTLPLRQRSNRMKKVLAGAATASLVASLFVFGVALRSPEEAPPRVMQSVQMAPSAVTDEPKPQVEDSANIDAGIDSSVTATVDSPDAASTANAVFSVPVPTSPSNPKPPRPKITSEPPKQPPAKASASAAPPGPSAPPTPTVIGPN